MKVGKLSYFFLFFVISAEITRNSVCNSERILVVAFISTKSHKLTYLPLVEELGKRGHNVTVLTPIKSTKKLLNVNDILTIDADSKNDTFMEDPFKKKEARKEDDPFTRADWIAQMCRETYDLPIVQQIMTEKFDLVMLQPLLNDCALGLVYRIGAPLVLFSPVSVPNFIASLAGVHFQKSFVPHVFIPLTPNMNFFQRMYNYAADLAIWYRFTWNYIWKVEAVYREKVGADVPDSFEVFKNTSLILSNGHFSVHGHKPLMPEIVEVGGLSRKSKIAKPLAAELEEFIGRGKNGFIFFSMGSLIKGNTMPEPKRKMFLKVFSKLKQQVIWKWETETMPDLPPNVKLSKWLPQEDVLGHKDIKLFITHCGGGGTEEAIYHGVPMIGLPMFGDQNLNAKLAKSHGILIEIDWNDLTEDLLLSSIQEVLNDPKYTNNVKRLSAIYKDQPQEPMTRAVFWIEYIMRHKGAPHLRSTGRKLNYFQYHSYDVILAYLGLIGGMLYVVFALLRWIVRKIFYRSTSTSNGKHRKTKSD